MRKYIAKSVKHAATLNDVRDALFSVFQDHRKRGHERIGYVSGVITSDGKEFIDRNILRLAKFTEHIRSIHSFPIFSPTDVFDDVLFATLHAAGYKNHDWMIFWDEVLNDREKYVADIFMTPRWKDSVGARDEHRIALLQGMRIWYIEKELENDDN